jgi:hypothetical protein
MALVERALKSLDDVDADALYRVDHPGGWYLVRGDDIEELTSAIEEGDAIRIAGIIEVLKENALSSVPWNRNWLVWHVGGLVRYGRLLEKLPVDKE